ncbi:MAG: hypothetical protein M3474_01275 [Actinomycetota bacterium]|nr:hypothetical protein [Actinomycetota bacterium]
MDVITYTAAPSTTRLYGRAVGGSLPRLRGSGRPADGLPDLQVRRLGVRTDLDQLATYVRITDGLLADRLPALFPHLAAFGPQLALLTDRRFGFAAMGLVHVQHRLTQHRPLLVGETYDLAVSPAGLRTHRRGQLIDIQTDATVHGETVWQETMTLLARGIAGGEVVDSSPLDGVDAPAGTMRWSVPAHTGRAYAAVSGDRNPIHLSRLTARTFGFPRAIAHGMWTAARALSVVGARLPAAFHCEMAFRHPVLLPAQVLFGQDSSAQGDHLLGVVSADATHQHLVARVRPL